MQHYLSAPIPRRLRVRASLTIGSKRVPLRIFILVAVVSVIAILAIIGGSDLTTTLWWSGAVIISGLIVLEGRLWGRDSKQIAIILTRHLRRKRTLRLNRPIISISSEAEEPHSARRGPRW
jgi:hypothetical protein